MTINHLTFKACSSIFTSPDNNHHTQSEDSEMTYHNLMQADNRFNGIAVLTSADLAGGIHNHLSKVREDAEELCSRIEAVKDNDTVEDSPLDEACDEAIELLNGMIFLFEEGEALEDAVQKVWEETSRHRAGSGRANT